MVGLSVVGDILKLYFVFFSMLMAIILLLCWTKWSNQSLAC